jgi:hypothetical protein
MNKVAHAVVLGFFALACWFLWGLLHVSGAVPLGGHTLPAYTRLCLALGPSILTALVVLATLYCIWVWARKADGRTPWVSFLSTATAVLSFAMLLVIVAAYLPLLEAVNVLAHP